MRWADGVGWWWWQDYGLLQPVLGAVMPEASKMIGETIIDLEDRWFCEEWSRKTVRCKPFGA